MHAMWLEGGLTYLSQQNSRNNVLTFLTTSEWCETTIVVNEIGELTRRSWSVYR